VGENRELTVDVDPAASVRIWALELDLGGRTFDVPALPASVWFPILLEGNPLLVLDLIEDEDVDDLLLSGQVAPDELLEALTVAIEQAAGRSFHAAFVLAQVAVLQWASVSGLMAERNFNWEDRPLGAALDLIYITVAKHLDKEASARFEQLLDNPTLTSGGRRRPANRDKAMADFEALAGPKPEGVKATGARSGSARPKTRPRPRQHPQAAPSRAPRPRP
jgi:hypothetical protein